MSGTIIAAVVAASAGLLGAFLASRATHSVERFRAHAALREKADERYLASVEAFLLAAHAWHDWLVLVGELGWTQNDEDRIKEMDRRVLQRDQAYRRLLLLSSPHLYRWLTETYAPAEYEVRRIYVHQIRFENHVDDKAKQARRTYGKLIREDLVEVARVDLAGLRNPRRWPGAIGSLHGRPRPLPAISTVVPISVSTLTRASYAAITSARRSSSRTKRASCQRGLAPDGVTVEQHQDRGTDRPVHCSGRQAR